VILPRDYQTRAEDQVVACLDEGGSPLLVSPTGSGKTVIACRVIRRLMKRHSRQIWFLAHRKELIAQASRKLDLFDVPHGVIAPWADPDPTAPVQVGSIQTVARRLEKMIPPGTIVFDEAHHVAAGTWEKVLGHYRSAEVLGLTATPFRTDGRGLGNAFSRIVQAATIADLVSQGYLVPARYFAPFVPRTNDLARRGSDFDPMSAAELMGKVTGDLVSQYRKHASGKRAVAFACTIPHSRDIAAAFTAAGIPAAHLDGDTPPEIRDQVLADLAAGIILVVSNCGLLSEGWDLPQMEAAILARPTMSLCLHLQQIGRVLRPCEGKTAAIILDHAGNTLRHGFASDEVPVTLESGIPRDRRLSGPALRTCLNCYAVLPAAARECSCCGRKLTPKYMKIKKRGGDLQEVKIDICASCQSDKISPKTDPDKGRYLECEACGAFVRWLHRPGISPRDYFQKLLQECIDNQWKKGRAFILFQKRYGRPPSKAEREENA